MNDDAKAAAVIAAARMVDRWFYNNVGAKLFRRIMRMGAPLQTLHDALQRLDGDSPGPAGVVVISAVDWPPVYTVKAGDFVSLHAVSPGPITLLVDDPDSPRLPFGKS